MKKDTVGKNDIDPYDPNPYNLDTVKVNKYDLNGKYLKTYNSIAEATKDVTGEISRSFGIPRCCNEPDKNFTYKGFQWRYCKGKFSDCKDITPHVRENTAKREVLKIDKETGKIVKNFLSIREASRDIGMSNTAFMKRLKKTGITEKNGFIWKYKN